MNLLDTLRPRADQRPPDTPTTAGSRQWCDCRDVDSTMQLSASRAVTGAWVDEVVGSDVHVPLLDGCRQPYVNLDNAASTPPLLAVRDAVEPFVPWYASVHRGAGFKSQVSTHAYEVAREAVGRFVGADPARQTVVFVRNTTAGLNKVARALGGSGLVVFTTCMEHHANLLPWQHWAAEVRLLDVDAEGRLDLGDLERQLRTAPSGRPRPPLIDRDAQLGHRSPLLREALLRRRAQVADQLDS